MQPSTDPSGAALAVVVILLLFPGCASNPGGERPALSEAEESRAIELFRGEICTTCHGELGGGLEGLGPALRGLAPYWNVERLMVYLENPGGFREANPDFEDRRATQYETEMPEFDYLSEEQRDLLARWLLSR